MEIKRTRRPDLLPEPISHYTDAVSAMGILWISGMLALDPQGNLVGEGNVVRQAEQVFANIQRLLEGEGASFADVVKVSLFLLRMEDREAINTVRRRVFQGSRPASTLVEVSALAVPGALLEVETQAVLPSSDPDRSARGPERLSL
ncbi:MAG: RidA family protein [Candidatus Dormibacteria bacterium]